MVGPWPLALHQDYLQYMYHVYLMQAGLKLGYYNVKYDALSKTRYSGVPNLVTI